MKCAGLYAMDHVSIAAAVALSGEEAFILQLRPPAPPGADEAALATRVDQFTALYLTGTGPERARFSRLGPLTWAIVASRFDADEVEAVRADLCQTLFGADTRDRAQLARQPSEPQADNLAGQPSAAARAAFDDDSDTFDIDSAVLDLDDNDVFEIDSWRQSEAQFAPDGSDADASPVPGAPVPDTAMRDAPISDAPGAPAHGSSDESPDALDDAQLDSWDVDSARFDDSDDGEPGDAGSSADIEDDVLGALAQLERAFAEDRAADAADAEPRESGAPDSDSENLDPDAGLDADLDTDTHDVFESYSGPLPSEISFDARRFEADLDAFEAAARAEDSQDLTDDFDVEAEDPWEPAAAGAPEPDRFESLTEAPSPRSDDLAGELAAFRREMREIARAIPGAGTSDALDHFRSELDAIAGSMGQRIDGAAQRIEAAADRIVSASGPEAADRFGGAAERAERSAALMESSVEDAVRALKAVLDAAANPGREALAGA